jgi:hypothetical protein
MRDFLKMALMLLLVFAFIAGAWYLSSVLHAPVMALLQVVIGIGIIIVVIKNFDKWFPGRRGPH